MMSGLCLEDVGQLGLLCQIGPTVNNSDHVPRGLLIILAFSSAGPTVAVV